MRAEHLKQWLATARKYKKEKETAGNEEVATTTEREIIEITAAKKETELDNWKRVVDLVQSDFREGKLVKKAMCQAVVLIPKGKKEYWGIGLVEVMWKVVAAILNSRLTTSITFHDLIHGFQAGRMTGTANLEAKLLRI